MYVCMYAVWHLGYCSYHDKKFNQGIENTSSIIAISWSLTFIIIEYCLCWANNNYSMFYVTMYAHVHVGKVWSFAEWRTAHWKQVSHKSIPQSRVKISNPGAIPSFSMFQHQTLRRWEWAWGRGFRMECNYYNSSMSQVLSLLLHVCHCF